MLYSLDHDFGPTDVERLNEEKCMMHANTPFGRTRDASSIYFQ